LYRANEQYHPPDPPDHELHAADAVRLLAGGEAALGNVTSSLSYPELMLQIRNKVLPSRFLRRLLDPLALLDELDQSVAFAFRHGRLNAVTHTPPTLIRNAVGAQSRLGARL
jgi:hypothetical protein